MVKICSNMFFGLIDGHSWVYPHSQTKRVCSKCGMYETLVESCGFEYDESYWVAEGVVDDPRALIRKWGLERKQKRKQERENESRKKELEKTMRDPKQHKQIKWEDA